MAPVELDTESSSAGADVLSKQEPVFGKVTTLNITCTPPEKNQSAQLNNQLPVVSLSSEANRRGGRGVGHLLPNHLRRHRGRSSVEEIYVPRH